MSPAPDTGQDAALATPSLTGLLSCRGNLFAIASLAWQDGDTPVTRLDADVVYGLAEWCLDQVAVSEEGCSLARVCEAFGQRPADYIGLTDPVLAYAFDVSCLVASRKESEAPRSEESVRFSVPDTGGA